MSYIDEVIADIGDISIGCSMLDYAGYYLLASIAAFVIVRPIMREIRRELKGHS